ncbi:hypothetical protein HMPREF1508_0078 [Shuttleworthella sp. MSX8B]|nr:hypothetical protein HMPREF1508_0078 [Shuttleworthia sp. MSX8B]
MRYTCIFAYASDKKITEYPADESICGMSKSYGQSKGRLTGAL